jgi:hypothetical protein
MTSAVIIGSVFFSIDNVVRVEQVFIGAFSDHVNNSGLSIN